MNSKTPIKKNGAAMPSSTELESLYHELLKWYFDECDFPRARKVAIQLEHLLNTLPEYAHSIRGEEIRAIIAELNDDLEEAIHSREAEIRKIMALHNLTINTPNWPSILKRYDFSDVSDRLDLLAALYDKSGDIGRAVAILNESKQLCLSHQIPFDAQDLLDELESDRVSKKGSTLITTASKNELDDTIRRVYSRFGTTADDIVISDRESRQFTSSVNSELPGELAATVQDVKRRLLALRKRRSSKGGLPRFSLK